MEEELWTSQFMSSVNVMVPYVNFTKLQADPGDPRVSDSLFNFVCVYCWCITYLIICFSAQQLNNRAGFERLVIVKVD